MGYEVMSEGLDRHITGNYGEDQFPEVEPPQFSEEELAIIRESVGRSYNELVMVSSIAAQAHRALETRINKYLEAMGW